MHDQAEELRALARRQAEMERTQAPAGSPRLVTVASGKGGVGATTVALNLAVALGLEGRRVVLVDADFDRSDVAAMCSMRSRHTVSDVLSGKRGIHEVLELGPGGVQVVAGPAGHGAPQQECTPQAQQRLIDALRQLGPHADLVLLDVGTGLSRVVRRFWQVSDAILLVSSAEPLAIMDTYAAIKVLGSHSPTQALWAAINSADDEATAEACYQRLARAGERFLRVNIQYAGAVLASAAIAEAARNGRPLSLDTGAAESTGLHRVSNFVAGQLSPSIPAPHAWSAKLGTARRGEVENLA
jgi:flagellar biosynthesis protein FlhG